MGGAAQRQTEAEVDAVVENGHAAYQWQAQFDHQVDVELEAHRTEIQGRPTVDRHALAGIGHAQRVVDVGCTAVVEHPNLKLKAQLDVDEAKVDRQFGTETHGCVKIAVRQPGVALFVDSGGEHARGVAAGHAVGGAGNFAVHLGRNVDQHRAGRMRADKVCQQVLVVRLVAGAARGTACAARGCATAGGGIRPAHLIQQNIDRQIVGEIGEDEVLHQQQAGQWRHPQLVTRSVHLVLGDNLPRYACLRLQGGDSERLLEEAHDQVEAGDDVGINVEHRRRHRAHANTKKLVGDGNGGEHIADHRFGRDQCDGNLVSRKAVY